MTRLLSLSIATLFVSAMLLPLAGMADQIVA